MHNATTFVSLVIRIHGNQKVLLYLDISKYCVQPLSLSDLINASEFTFTSIKIEYIPFVV